METTAIETTFAIWQSRADQSLQTELESMAYKDAARHDAFFQDLTFGTGGLRGIVGAGTNRMNIHTVARATQGLADYLNARYDAPTVAIARDSRHKGEEFLHAVVSVLAANGIRSFAYPRVEPTPALSWAVRDLHCSAGICITASHNPAEYNGYKVYGSDGCQITTQAAQEIQGCIETVDIFDGVRSCGFDEAFEQSMLTWIPDKVLDRYIDAVLQLSPSHGAVDLSDLSITYTPLNGTGLECVSRILEQSNIGKISVVEEQAAPDGDFPTCPYPNPEEHEALALGLEECRRNGSDLLIATDPDADRIGVAAIENGEPVILTGNEVGMILLDYICRCASERSEDLSNKVVITTIVSGPMADAMAEREGFELRRTLTGFKFIGEQIGFLESAGEQDRFLFGFEESCGYLSGPHVRDKDAVNATMLVSEAAAWHKRHGRNLADAIRGIYAHYGFYKEGLVSVSYPGAGGAAAMSEIMDGLRNNPPATLAGKAVTSVIDYAQDAPMPIMNQRDGGSQEMLPQANVIEMVLENGCKLIVRPSGTEPKAKAYAMARAETAKEAESALATLLQAAKELLQ